MNAITYLKRKEALLYTTRVLKGGKMFAIVDGLEIPEKHFKAANQLPDRLYINPNNPDKRKSFLNV